MKKTFLFLLILISLEIYADSHNAVKETNFHVGISHTEIDDDFVGNWRSTSLSSGVSFPIYDYIGSSILIQGSKSGTLKYDYYNYHYTTQSDSYVAAVNFFLRDKTIGKVGINGQHSKNKTTTNLNDGSTTYTHKSTTDINNYSLYGSYYWHDFTLNAYREVIDIDNGHHIHTSNTSIGYYLNENTSAGASISGMDSQNKFHISFQHQPSYFQNSTIVGLTYLKNNHSESFTLFLSYHFETRVSLKTRDREYR
jgi:hypothetical protein